MTSSDAILAMVTCGPQLEVALLCPSQPGPSVVRLSGGSPRSKLLLAAVELLIEDAGIDRSIVGRVAVSRGPGSFTGIRAGLAAASGFEAGIGARVFAYDSLLVQASRAHEPGEVWAAQPGRRGEVYAQRFLVAPGQTPVASSDIQILSVDGLTDRGPWLAAESQDLGAAQRALTVRSAAEGLIRLVEFGVESSSVEPLYVEGPPIHRKTTDG